MDEEIENPSLFLNQMSFVTNFFANYGWYVLISLIATLYLYETYLKSLLKSCKDQKDEAEYSAKYHKNPDLLSARLLAQEKRAREMQDKHRKDAEDHKRKLEKRKQKRKEELIEKYNDGGITLGPSGSKSFKPEYYPLMGAGNSSNYKPQKKSACTKGGCGG